MDNTMLNRFYEDNVKMTRDETSKNVEFVIPLVDDILQYVHERDGRFKIQPLNVGSYYSRLKVSRADEFDYSVVVDIGSSLVWTTGTPAYYGYNGNKEVVRTSIPLPSAPAGKCFTQLKGLIQKWDNERLNEGLACLTIDDHIIPIKVKRRFKALVSEAVNRPKIRQYVDAQRLSESPAATLTIRHPKIAGETISVDLAPLIEGHLSFKPEFGWPRSGSRWPSRTKIEEIKTEGIHEVAKDPFYWSLSFVICEKKLLDGIDSNGTCRKKSQRIMKKLREKWCPKGYKQELTSYHLKNILFWECENHPYDAEWTNEQLSVRIESMCYLIIQHIQRGNLPLYFHTGVNLLENKDKDVLGQVVQNIFRFLKNPEHYLT
ncbi:protein mab-21-like 3 [Mytilus californianus]|uniref:protein mab-21-like 3 n=1 Tax=Mytilus californianus TaxID=6549 RepID=UPI0022481847|nr:protein mab-21-like 3 [Mytilus californianus]